MRLTVHTDYALRILMYLALKKDGLATITEIAATYDISKNHLMKVAYKLSVAGYVESARGRGGGLRLAKPVEAIMLGEVVRKTEPDMPLIVQGMEHDDPSRALFVVRRAMNLASAGFLKALDGYTLADLIGRARSYARYLPFLRARAMWRRSQTASHGREAGPNGARSRHIGGRILMMMSGGNGGRRTLMTPSPHVCYRG